jgi:hypothetical protein
MGLKCAGGIAPSGKEIRARVQRNSGRVYQSVGASGGLSLLFAGGPPARPLSKRELYHRLKEERRRSFDAHQPFQCGMLMQRKMPLMYEPLEDGNWKENPSGRVIPHERLQQYLTRYRLI